MGSFFKRLFGKDDSVKEGDIVVCIDDRNWNGTTSIELQFKKKYKTISVIKSCHGRCYDIGGRFTDNRITHTTCTTCKGKIQGQGIHWAGEFRFRKATPDEAAEYYREQEGEIKTQIEKAVEVENYELADKLTKELEKH